jgi:hypothetical protein
MLNWTGPLFRRDRPDLRNSPRHFKSVPIDWQISVPAHFVQGLSVFERAFSVTRLFIMIGDVVPFDFQQRFGIVFIGLGVGCPDHRRLTPGPNELKSNPKLGV